MVNSLTARQIRRTTNRFVIGTAAMSIACSSIALISATADAATREYSCRAGGFTGTIRVDYNQGIGRNASSIIEVSYKINKGSNKGGNKANVTYSDGGTLPIKRFNTGDAGIQNNQWNYLGGSYTRGYGSVAARFIFDKSRASDPSCRVNITF
ncbi:MULTISPECIES: hypothetical protein [unclassified Nostoc]|uniref:Spore coat protein U domain-containing protein n=1 Tax=Nostoc punctiforme NIES-2108 TaxID=1356359 RepID=A0A367S0F9_NOSPU|nr:hypothetical protein [Nostoc sp. JL31]MBN3889754.1 hypothetical protein [Nostoc sp. JL31]RCJ41453.1 hypothetical protein A6769_00620 [Nostoc punctiforme NIES-2108]